MSSADRSDAWASVGGRLFTHLTDVTGDLSALDSRGTWVVVITFEGAVTCARFARTAPAPAPPPAAGAGTWAGAPTGDWVSSLDRDGFAGGVAAIRSAIGAGDVYQVNLCRVLRAAAGSDPDVAGLARVLATANPAPHAASVHLPSSGIRVVSASPELFLRRVGERVESRPIKGTAAAAGGFLAKDRAENVMIVDLVRNDLGRVSDYGTVAVPALCAVESHPGLHHMVSTVTARLRPGVGWSELLAATFPPGSVVGAPKLAALEVIGRLEPVPRGPYCGTIGWVDAGARTGELNVAIRTFWWDDGHWHLGTGGGITWDSTATGEWEETELKARRLLAATVAAVPR